MPFKKKKNKKMLLRIRRKKQSKQTSFPLPSIYPKKTQTLI